MGNLAGWPYWKVISITGQAGAGTDYQIELEIGDSAGGDFHLEGNCTNFPQDIRITDDDGTTLLDHFVFDLTADPITVKVEVKDDLGSNQDIRVYYGKSGETSASNGANTFLQYHGVATSDFLDALTFSPTPAYVWEGKVKRTAEAHNTLWGLSNTATQTDDASCVQSYDKRYCTQKNDGTGTHLNEAPVLTNNQYYHGKIIYTGSIATSYFDSNEIGSGGISTNNPNENLGLWMWAAAGTCAQEWSFVRKYNSPEPAFGSAGAEQSPTGVSPTGVFCGPLVGPFGGPI